VPKS
jgi:transcriptional regulator with XRE-family HTH domain